MIATKLYRTESPPNFIYSNGNGKILIKPTNEMKWKKMVFATKFRFGSRLSKGKVLAPLTSIVLDGTHLIILVIDSYLIIYLRSNYYMDKNKRDLGFFIVELAKIFESCAYVFPRAMGKSERS